MWVHGLPKRLRIKFVNLALKETKPTCHRKHTTIDHIQQNAHWYGNRVHGGLDGIYAWFLMQIFSVRAAVLRKEYNFFSFSAHEYVGVHACVSDHNSVNNVCSGGGNTPVLNSMKPFIFNKKTFGACYSNTVYHFITTYNANLFKNIYTYESLIT